MSENKSVEHLLREVEEITRQASMKVNERVFRYGRFRPHEPERELLQAEIRKILRSWAERLFDLGVCPQEPWKVLIETPEGPILWEYPHTQFEEGPHP